jgi:hypothetical protein
VDSIGPIIFLVLCVLFIWWSYQQGRAGAASFKADRRPDDVVMAALQTFSQRGWTTTSQTVRSISFSKSQAPGCLITFFLLLFGIIPGLLYWIAAKRTLTVSVTAQPAGAGTGSMVSVAWSRNGGGRGPSLEFQNLLAPGAPITVADVPSLGAIRSGIEDFTGGALSAAEVRRQSAASLLPAGSAGSGAPDIVPTPSAAFCPNCGAAVSAGQRFCASCGHAIGGPGSTA